MTDKYITGKEATEKLGVHQRTLYQWDKKGWIETIRTDDNKRLYNIDKYLREKKKDIKAEEELAYDVIQIMNVFTAKMNGLRKYNKKQKE